MAKETLHPQASNLLSKKYSAQPSLDGPLTTRPGQGRTNQAAAAQNDIRYIVDRFLKTGLRPAPLRPEQFGDASAVPSLQTALQNVATSRQLYDRLPEQVRKETDGDPARVEAWLKDPRNTSLAIKLGLLKERPQKPAPAPAQGPQGGQGGPEAPPKPTPTPTEKP